MAGVNSRADEPQDQTSGGRPPGRTSRRVAVAGLAAAALAVGGGVMVAQASAAPSGTPSATPSASGTAAPGKAEPRERTPHLSGTVVSVSGTTITITDREGFQRTIHTSASTTYADGLTASPAAGTKIHAEGTVDADKVSLAATKISAQPDRPAGGRHGGRHGGRGHGPGGDAAPSTSPGTPSASPSTPTPAPTS